MTQKFVHVKIIIVLNVMEIINIVALVKKHAIHYQLKIEHLKNVVSVYIKEIIFKMKKNKILVENKNALNLRGIY